MQSLFEDIQDFHRRFGLEYHGRPRRLPEELGPFRIGFIAEELAEYVTPKDQHHARIVGLIKSYYDDMGAHVSLEKQFDALIDLVYVAIGTAYLQGFDFDAGWARVHKANMRKVRAERKEQSLRGSTFDVVKPEGWVPPNLSDLVQEKPVKKEDTRIAYGAQCSWWDDIGKVGNRAGLPCCPKCQGVLFEMQSPEEWWRGVDAHEKDRRPGYRAFVEWARGRCYRGGYAEAMAAFTAETGKVMS